MIIKDVNVTINISDMDRSVLFYEQIGFSLQKRWSDHYARLTAPGIAIGLHPTGSTNIAPNSGNVSLGFTTDHFEEAKILLDSLQVANLRRDEEGGQFLHFTDPDGNSLYFINPRW